MGLRHCAWLIAAIASLGWSLSLAAQGTYSPGGWPTLHQDSGNRRAVATDVVGREYRAWHALQGASVLTAPTTSPDGRTLYVTTGLGPGNSNLHAFALDGTPLWQASPWQNADNGVDPCALLSSPIVDDEGDIYIGDCNQLFAFKPDGEVKWIIHLPPVQAEDWQPVDGHPVNALTTAAFTVDGDILGVTNFGDIIVVDRHSGRLRNHAYRLPGLIPPYSTVVPMPDSLLADGMMDPRFKEWAWQLIFGGNMRSANTPAVSTDGRLFVVGSGREEGVGALYGLDLLPDGERLRIEEVFATGIGLGSGSSPAVSPSGHQVYVSDEEGWLYGVDAGTGEVDWKEQTRAAAGAAGVDADGTIYALQANAPAVVAVSPEGEVRWESDLTSLSQQFPESWLLGAPDAFGSGNPTIVGDAVLVPVGYGYPVPIPGFDFSLPVKSTVVAIDRQSGKAIGDVVALPDDSSGITAVLADGTIVSSLGGVLTSAISPVKPIADLVLPGDLTMMAPRGGIQVAIPARQ